MSRRDISRRTVLKGIGATAALGVTGTANAHAAEWVEVDTPTAENLNGITVTDGTPVAVGDGGEVLLRSNGEWVRILDDGVNGNGRNLHDAATAPDGSVWVAGNSGAIGRLDVGARSIDDYSAPNGATGTFHAIDVTSAGVFVTDGSGQVHTSFDGGEAWSVTTPGSGSAIVDIDFYADRVGRLADTNGAVFATADGRTWEKVGIEDADRTFHALDTDGPNWTAVATRGRVLVDSDEGWERRALPDGTYHDVQRHPCGCLFLVGDGPIVQVSEDGELRERNPTGTTLNAVSPVHPPIAVGDSGTVLELRQH